MHRKARRAIYLKVQHKAEIVEKIRKHLKPSGFLVLGAAESLLGVSDDFQQQFGDGGVFYKRIE